MSRNYKFKNPSDSYRKGFTLLALLKDSKGAVYVFFAKDYLYSSAIDYTGEKGLIDNIILAELNV